MKLQNKKIWLIALLVILLPSSGIALYLFTKKKKDSEEEKLNADTNNNVQEATQESNTPQTDTTNLTFPLVKNKSAKTELVKQLQRYLNEEIEGLKLPNVPRYNNRQIKQLTVDGIYGDRTAAVVKYVFPGKDGNTVTEDMYQQLIEKRQAIKNIWKAVNK